MNRLTRGEIEKIRSQVHDLPWLPDKREAQAYEHNRVRMGDPDATESLLHRYREVISGVSPKNWTDKDFLVSYRFEWALADLLACQNCECKHCSTTEIKRWARPDGKPMIIRKWFGCRTVCGSGWYMDLHLERTRAAGKPVFVMTNCESPARRLEIITGRTVQYR